MALVLFITLPILSVLGLTCGLDAWYDLISNYDRPKSPYDIILNKLLLDYILPDKEISDKRERRKLIEKENKERRLRRRNTGSLSVIRESDDDIELGDNIKQ